MNNFIKPLKWVTYAIMPLVYDESLSYVELLNKVVAKLNEVIAETNTFQDNVDTVVSAWLMTPEGSAAFEGIVKTYIEAYSKTEDFHAVLVDALAEQSDEISAAAKAAAEAYLSGASGEADIEAACNKFLGEYVKTPEFAAVLQDFLEEQFDIKRGTSLSIKQKESVDIDAPVVAISSAVVGAAWDATRSNTFRLNGQGVALLDGSGATVFRTDIANKDLLMPGLTRITFFNDGGKIQGLAAPAGENDAANKKYVDDMLSGVSGDSILSFITVRANVSAGTVQAESSYADIKALFPRVYLYDAVSKSVFTPLCETASGLRFACVSPSGDTGDTLTSNTIITISTSNVWSVKNATFSEATVLPLNGSRDMTGTLNMGKNKISGLAEPAANSDAATKQYVDANARAPVLYFEGYVSNYEAEYIEGLTFNEVLIAVNSGTRVLTMTANQEAYDFTLVATRPEGHLAQGVMVFVCDNVIMHDSTGKIRVRRTFVLTVSREVISIETIIPSVTLVVGSVEGKAFSSCKLDNKLYQSNEDLYNALEYYNVTAISATASGTTYYGKPYTSNPASNMKVFFFENLGGKYDVTATLQSNGSFTYSE